MRYFVGMELLSAMWIQKKSNEDKLNSDVDGSKKI
jgi:hypothetical protein